MYCIAVSGCTFAIAKHFVDRIHNHYETIVCRGMKQVFVAKQDIKAGEVISEKMLEERTALCSQKEELLFSKEDIGKEAVVDIKAGSFLSRCLANQSGPVEELREVCYRSIDLSGNVRNHDVVDIRIRYPGGDDYIILSGKRIRFEEDTYGVCYLRVNEEELLLMSAAIADVESNEGVRIYTSRYLEPAIQKKSVVTYKPRADVIESGRKE